MAEISTQVANRIKWARFVIAAYRIHGAPIAQSLASTYDGVDIDKMMEAMATHLDEVTDRMRQSELDLAVELSDDDTTREHRDGTTGQMRDQLYQARSLIDGGFGEGATRAYGLASTPPRQPDALLAFAANAVNLLEQNPRSEQDPFGNTIDTAKIAAAVSQTHTQLEQTLEAVDAETRQAHSKRAARDATVEEWSSVFHGTATVLSGLFILAGRPDLAERVRPTMRRSEGKSEPPEDMDTAGDGAETPAVDVDEPVEA